MKRTRLVCVGAACIDTILNVPHYPEEDSKLRATSMSKRRGGNTPNTMEVLQQLIDQEADSTSLELFLIAALPNIMSEETTFISRSLDPDSTTDGTSKLFQSRHKINLAHCMFRERYVDAISAYVINSAASSSRTVINFNDLPEITLDEFQETCVELVKPVYELYAEDSANEGDGASGVSTVWFHFEGRNTETTLECMRYLRAHPEFATNPRLKLRMSVELEKPRREGLFDLAREADVIFYSKAWARGEGYPDAATCLKEQARQLQLNPTPHAQVSDTTLICTWGDYGSCATILHPGPVTGEPSIVHSSAFLPPGKPIVDSTGAGDTFIAGMLFGLTGKYSRDEKPGKFDGLNGLKGCLLFATRLAGHKICQQGFQDLLATDELLQQGVRLFGEA